MEKQPTVRAGYLHGAGHKFPLSLESPSWKDWLRVHKRFYIASGQARISVYKLNNRWVAQKRIKGKLRQQWLGSSAQLAGCNWRNLGILAEAMARESD